MLQKLNERLQGVVAWVIIILVAITFTLFGVESYFQSRQSSTQVAVEVNGYPISKELVHLKYERMRQVLEAQGMAGLDKQYKQRILDELILNQLSLQSATKNGFNVSSAQADAAIMQIPEFQDKGQFSSALYQQKISSAMFTHDSFQNEVRNGMLLNQQRFAFVGTAFALPNEIDSYIKEYNQTRDYQYLKIPSSLFLDTVTVLPQEAADYYKQNTKLFLTPEAVSLEYVQLSMADVKANIQISADELMRFYDENKANFTNKDGHSKPFVTVEKAVREQLLAERAQREYSRILEELTDLSYQTPDELTSLSKMLHLPLKKTPVFTQAGGSISVIKNAEVIQAAFSHDVLTLGNNSSPIQLDNETVVVVRVSEHMPAHNKPFMSVKADIEQIIKREKAQAQATQLGDAIWHAKDDGVREQLITSHHLTWKFIKEATREGKEPSIAVNALAFSLPNTPNALEGRLLNDEQAYVVVALKQVKDGDPKSIDKDQLAGIIEQIETNDGGFDYELYIRQLREQAKIAFSS